MADSAGWCMELSILVCTYNRRHDLAELIDFVLSQQTDPAFTFELLIVDNNSDDGTRELIEEYCERFPNALRYIFESQQGKSYALRTGLDHAKGEWLFVADSDQVLPAGYLQKMAELIRDNPEVSIIGGKELPLWPAEPPARLTERHWSAIGMLSYGEQPFLITANRPLCLLVATSAARSCWPAATFACNWAFQRVDWERGRFRCNSGILSGGPQNTLMMPA